MGHSASSPAQLDLAALLAAHAPGLLLEAGRSEPPGAAARLGARLARLQGAELPCTGRLVLRCDACRVDRHVAFRCLGGCELCPRGAERRAAALARMLPRVPVRHWTLSLPPSVRRTLASDEGAIAAIVRVFVQEIFAILADASPLPRGRRVHCGAATLVHRTGSALNLDIHLHALVLDGVYTTDAASASASFHPLREPPGGSRVRGLARRVLERLRGALAGRAAGASAVAPDPLRRIHAAAISQRAALGPRAGASARQVRVASAETARRAPTRELAAVRDGLEVHAGPAVPPGEREAILRLTRYVTRPAFDRHAFSAAPEGRVRYRLKEPFRDGTTHVEFDPAELAERLAALVPDGGRHRIGYHGILAPRAAARWRVLPTQLALVEVPRAPRATAARREPLPALPDCERCGGGLRVVAVEEVLDAP